MEEILPGITKYIIDDNSGGNLLQFLPLNNDGADGTGNSFGPLEP
jgi:hypothetical protein